MTPQAVSRLRQRGDFLHAQRGGERFRGRKLTLILAAQEVPGSPRFGLTVSRKVGSAVVRNKVRRRLRELCRQHSASMAAGFDYVIVAGPSAAACEFQALGKELAWLLERSVVWTSCRQSCSH